MRQVFGPGALGRPRGIGWRGRWEGGLGWGIDVNPWLIHVNIWQKPLQYCKVISLQLIHVNIWQKPLQYCKVISLQLIKINGKKIKKIKIIIKVKKKNGQFEIMLIRNDFNIYDECETV